MVDFVTIPYTSDYGVHLWTTNLNKRACFRCDSIETYMVYGHVAGKIIMMSKDIANYTQHLVTDTTVEIINETTSEWDYTITFGENIYRYLHFNLPSNFPFELETTNYATVNDFVSVVYAAYPITYRLTNCTAPSAPSEALVGDTVTVPLVFSEGYGISNTENVYVTNNGVLVPSTYSNGTLTFTMPDPS